MPSKRVKGNLITLTGLMGLGVHGRELRQSGMFRLSKAQEGRVTVLVIDGELTGDYIRCVEDSCKEAVMDGKTVHLRLHRISAVDGAGRSLLSRLVQMGVKLQATGMYTSFLVEAFTSSKGKKDDVE